MKRLTLILILALCMAGCTKEEVIDPIVGKWELIDLWGTFNDGTPFVDVRVEWKFLEFSSDGYVYYHGFGRTEYERVADDDVIIWGYYDGVRYEDHYIIETLTDQELQLHYINMDSIEFSDNAPYHDYYRFRRCI